MTTVHESHFRSDEDNRSEAEKEQPRPEKWTGRLKAEHQIEWERTIQQKLQDWKYGTKLDKDEIASLRRGTKRPLEDSESDREIKRLRLCLPVTTLKVSTTEFGNEPRVSGAGNLNENLVLRINHEKFNVVMRNAKLTDLAENCIGTSTSRVYAEVLRKLDPSLRRCKSLTGSLEEDDETDLVELPQVSTHELATLFKDAAYFIDTIGQVDPDQINLALIDHPKKLRKKNSTNDLAKGVPAVDDVSSDEDSDNESDCSASSFSFDADSLPSSFSINESKSQPTALPFDSQDVRAFFSTIHQHLLLLYDHPNRFLRRVPKTSSVPEKWAVDFGALRATLVDVTLSQILSSRFGPLATRLASILKSSGKLDEKTLSTLSLINQKTMRALLTAMYRSGLLQLQEIPREGNRQPSRTLYLWDWEPERAKQTVLEDCYAAMGRLVRRLGVERERVKGVVDKAARSDVMGREAEFLSGPEMKALEGWRSTEQKLWGELDRLDDCVAVVRDF